jgi:MFS-type transporter involved in bile tolerance (Atg22 family)
VSKVATLGNASDAFLLLKAGVEDTPLTTLPLLWMALHVVKSLTSLWGGRLADRWGRRRTIALGWSLYVVIYVGFAFAESQLAFWVVSDVIARSRWGRGFGVYHMTVGALSFVASILFGALWATFSAATAFLTSAAIAACASLVLLLLVPDDSPRTTTKDPP